MDRGAIGRRSGTFDGFLDCDLSDAANQRDRHGTVLGDWCATVQPTIQNQECSVPIGSGIQDLEGNKANKGLAGWTRLHIDLLTEPANEQLIIHKP